MVVHFLEHFIGTKPVFIYIRLLQQVTCLFLEQSTCSVDIIMIVYNIPGNL